MADSEKRPTLLNTQGYRGTRDFYPELQRIRNFLYQKIATVMHGFGYEAYSGPFVEHFEIFAAKSGEELVREQIYSFKDKGDRLLAIRPEMTPTLARMVAAKQRELLKPIRWYSIPTCMRFERPQRGRLREFDQLNVDIFGGNPLDEDIEILLTAANILLKIGAKTTDFEIKINHRGIINNFLDKILGVSQESAKALLKIIDKKDKITHEEFIAECQKISLSEGQIAQLQEFLTANIDKVVSLLGPEYSAPAVEIQSRIAILSELISPECFKFSPEIMRGLDYYTGMVFEVFDTHPDNRRALFGGGRYDNLIGCFSEDELPGVGYGMGDVALLNFMEVHQLTPQLSKQTDVCVIRFHENDRLSSLRLADILRQNDLNVECSVVNAKFGKQIQYAEKIKASIVAFQGEEELKNNSFAVKWLASGVQENYPFSAAGCRSLADKIQGSRH